MDNKIITFNGIKVTCYVDGSVEWEHGQWNGKEYRTFGSRTRKGYRSVCIGGQHVRVHLLIANAFLPDYSDALQVDHVYGERSDNRPSRLRMKTASQNAKGFQSKRGGTLSKLRGVSKRKKKTVRWSAKATVDGKAKHLGYYDTEREAGVAFDKFALANGYAKEALNFPDDYQEPSPVSEVEDRYGYTKDGALIVAPNGWEIVPEGESRPDWRYWSVIAGMWLVKVHGYGEKAMLRLNARAYCVKSEPKSEPSSDPFEAAWGKERAPAFEVDYAKVLAKRMFDAGVKEGQQS
jgi:hypothetical protein